jgi:hypothetical protein
MNTILEEDHARTICTKFGFIISRCSAEDFQFSTNWKFLWQSNGKISLMPLAPASYQQHDFKFQNSIIVLMNMQHWDGAI